MMQTNPFKERKSQSKAVKKTKQQQLSLPPHHHLNHHRRPGVGEQQHVATEPVPVLLVAHHPRLLPLPAFLHGAEGEAGGHRLR